MLEPNVNCLPPPLEYAKAFPDGTEKGRAAGEVVNVFGMLFAVELVLVLGAGSGSDSGSGADLGAGAGADFGAGAGVEWEVDPPPPFRRRSP